MNVIEGGRTLSHSSGIERLTIRYSKPGLFTQYWWSMPEVIMNGNNGVAIDVDDASACLLEDASIQIV